VLNAAFADRAKSSRLLDALVAAGRLGQKSGAGFYSYAKGARGQDDPAFAAILEKCRTGKRAIDQEEITERLFLPMLTEASRVLMEGIVREPADGGMGVILGIGCPAEARGRDAPAFATILEKCRTGKRAIDQEEITERLFLPMLTEASRVLMEGIVREPADVDMGLILGIGFPPQRGGLLRWADSLGLQN